MFAVISHETAKRLALPIVPYRGKTKIVGWNLEDTGEILGRVRVHMRIAGIQRRYSMWVVPEAAGFDGILGAGWMEKEDVALEPAKRRATMRRRGKNAVLACDAAPEGTDKRVMEAAGWLRGGCRAHTTKKHNEDEEVVRVAVGVQPGDIEIALEKLDRPTEPAEIPAWIEDLRHAFEPHADGRVRDHSQWDMKIDLTTEELDKLPHAKPRPMAVQELVYTRRLLRQLEAKGFIRKSKSRIASPVNLAHKSGGGVRFCIDYRKLNAVTLPDRYPTPLISDTLRLISRARILSRMDVASAFHRMRVARGHEWKTAFVTRDGLYEWLVSPFGARNSSPCFQRWIYHVLRDLIDAGVVIYIDDILVYSTDRAEHRRVVREVLRRLAAAGLPVDPRKCEFEVQTTKFLGVMLHAGRGVSMDPEKVKAIVEYVRPTCVTGLRRFLGMATYYRRFIPSFAELTAPISEMITGNPKKRAILTWTAAATQAFEELKRRFTTTLEEGGILMEWQAGKPARMETDASSWAMGGQLMQEDENNDFRPVAYFSHKLTRTERNWSTFDKELGAVIRGLREWAPELRSAPEIEVVTDHKTLQYFQNQEPRTEKQIRWKDELDAFPLRWTYRAGEENLVADALSRKENDKPDKAQAIEERTMAIIALQTPHTSTGVEEQEATARIQSLEDLWKDAEEADTEYRRWKSDVAQQKRQWTAPRPHQVSIAECKINSGGKLLWRERQWVPQHEKLRTTILRAFHDMPTAGHPGRDSMRRAVGAQFWWPNLTMDVARYVRNCDVCGRTRIWREKEGLLKPLPTAEAPWRHISMDFAVDLPTTKAGESHVLVAVDRMTKEVELCPTRTMETNELVDIFLRRIVGRHGFPESIVSDRGPQFRSSFWRALCQRAGIELRMSTAYQPETDGQSERMVQSMKDILRKIISTQPACTRSEEDWARWIPLCQLAMNSRTSATTGFSPFFLTHGTHPRAALEHRVEMSQGPRAPREAALRLASRLSKAWDWTIAATERNKEAQEAQANRKRRAAPAYRVGDKVWLTLRDRQQEASKFGPRNGKYTVVKVLGSHSYQLDTPPGTHSVFHVSRLRPASVDPFPSQQEYDPHPPPAVPAEDGEDAEWEIDFVDGERWRGNRPEVRVHWIGYDMPDWQPRKELLGTTALKSWEQQNPPTGRLKRWRDRYPVPTLPDLTGGGDAV